MDEFTNWPQADFLTKARPYNLGMEFLMNPVTLSKNEEPTCSVTVTITLIKPQGLLSEGRKRPEPFKNMQSLNMFSSLPNCSIEQRMKSEEYHYEQDSSWKENQINRKLTEDNSRFLDSSSKENVGNERCDLSGRQMIQMKSGCLEGKVGLKCSEELVETILALVSNQYTSRKLKSEEELNLLKLFISQASHRKGGSTIKRRLESLTIDNYLRFLPEFTLDINRHRKNENVRTVMTLLHKFVRNKSSSLKSVELERFQRNRYPVLQIVKQCRYNPEFHRRLVSELQSNNFRQFCITNLKSQLSSYLLNWGVIYRETGKWRARFIAFPLEIEYAAHLLSRLDA